MRNPAAIRTSRLFIQLVAICVPAFVFAASLMLAILAHYDAIDREDALSARLGAASARISAALERHILTSHAAEPWSEPLPHELLASLLGDRAVLCARLENLRTAEVLVEVPAGGGCVGRAPDRLLKSEVEGADGARLVLRIGVSTRELAMAEEHWLRFSSLTMIGALLIALVAAGFAFHVVVGRPLHRLKRDLVVARREIERSGRVRSEFLATISHDIRTPLNGVVALAGELRREIRSREHLDLISRICESSETLLDLANTFLDWSRIDAGKLDFDDAPFSPLALVGKVEHTYGQVAAQKGVRLRSVTLGDCAGTIHGDPRRILQVLHNVVGNAVKFTQQGEVALTVDRRNQGVLRIEVADTGIGISTERLDGIFDSYEQAESAIALKFGGAGLGLAIVRRLVAGMNGAVDVASKLGEGAVFNITIPIREEAMTAPSHEAPDELLACSAVGLRVLAADDVPTNRLVLEKLLARIGASADVRTSGAEVVEAIGSNAYDVVLMDISMPNMNGVAALVAIRDKEASLGLTPTPVIAVTANALDHQVERYLARGFAAHVPKPVSLKQLVAALLEVRGGAATTQPVRKFA